MLVVVTSATLESEKPVIKSLEDAESLTVKVYSGEERASWSRKDFLRALSEADIWLTSNEYPIDADTLSSASMLKLIALNCAGTDHVDLSALEQSGVILCNTGGVSTEPVSEFIWAQILNLLRKVSLGDAVLRKGQWNDAVGKSLSLGRATVGLIGYGAIGRRVVEKGAGLCRSFLVYRRSLEKRFPVNSQVELCPDLDDVLREADILVIACPLTKETMGLIGEREFSLMKPHALLVNSMRGAVVDERALISALEKKTIGGAALDVFDEEPLPRTSGFLSQRGNVILTPHLAGLTADAVEAAAFAAADNAISFSRGGRLKNRIN